MQNIAESLGSKIMEILRQIGSMAMLFADFVRCSLSRPIYFKLLIDQIYSIGIQSMGLTFITAASTGMVMALQFGVGLEKFGGKLYVPKIVALSIVREIGPVFCSLMLAARVGAGIASEIGSMLVTQQIDAMRALGTSPIRKIVVPRILGCLISIPLLVSLGDLVGVSGAAVVGVHELGLDPSFFVEKVLTTVVAMDFMAGVGKSAFFALFIGLASCYHGLNVKGGTQGVGTATKMAVVSASIMILVSDYFLTKFIIIFLE